MLSQEEKKLRKALRRWSGRDTDNIPMDAAWSREYSRQFRADIAASAIYELARAVRWEAFFQYVTRQGLLVDRFDFVDFRLDKAADFLAAWVEPGDGVGEVKL